MHRKLLIENGLHGFRACLRGRVRGLWQKHEKTWIAPGKFADFAAIARRPRTVDERLRDCG
jgi:hypothetical protein